jgi:hypothetical protein
MRYEVFKEIKIHAVVFKVMGRHSLVGGVELFRRNVLPLYSE